MTQRKRGLALTWMLIVHVGCSAATPSIADSSEEASTSEELFPHGMLLTIPGTIDEENRYLPAVRISTVIIDADHKKHYKPCSGVLIHPRLVITAGHCVCLERSPTAQEQVPPQASPRSKVTRRSTALTRAEALEGVGRITGIIDNKSLCARDTIVTTLIYSSHDGHRGGQQELRVPAWVPLATCRASTPTGAAGPGARRRPGASGAPCGPRARPPGPSARDSSEKPRPRGFLGAAAS
jgi:hypothetical protein